MRKIICALVVALCSACGATPPVPSAPNATMPDMPSQPAASAASSEIKAAGAAKIGDKTKCPVAGEEFVVTAESPKVEHAGKTYYFCCKGCDKKFQADPEKYLKKS